MWPLGWNPPTLPKVEHQPTKSQARPSRAISYTGGEPLRLQGFEWSTVRTFLALSYHLPLLRMHAQVARAVRAGGKNRSPLPKNRKATREARSVRDGFRRALKLFAPVLRSYPT